MSLGLIFCGVVPPPTTFLVDYCTVNQAIIYGQALQLRFNPTILRFTPMTRTNYKLIYTEFEILNLNLLRYKVIFIRKRFTSLFNMGANLKLIGFYYKYHTLGETKKKDPIFLLFFSYS